MAIATLDVQTNWTSGAVSPRFKGRPDVGKFQNAALIIENALVFPLGGIANRSGTRFVIEAKNQASATTLFPFEFSDIQAYVIEAGVNYFRFYRNQGQIVAPNVTASITNGTFDADISGWTNRSAGSGAIAFDTDHMNLVGAGTGNEARAEQNISITETSTVHVLRFEVDGTLGKFVNVRIGSTSGAVNILAEAAFGIGHHCVEFTPGASNAFLQFRNDESASTTLQIDDVSLVDNAAVEIGSPFAAADLPDFNISQSADTAYLAHSTYAPYKLTRSGHSSWSLTKVNFGTNPFTTSTTYPAAVGFFEERLVFGGTTDNPNKLWFSKAGDFENMDPASGDPADAIIVTIADGEVNIIRWFETNGGIMVIGTLGAEYLVSRQDRTEALNPDNIKIEPQTNYGVRQAHAARVNNTVIFVQRLGHKIREFVFDFESDAYVAPDLLLLAEHFGKGATLEDLEYSQDPTSVLWCRRSDGILLGATLERRQEVIAWHNHKIAGTDGARSYGYIESITKIPGATHDELWLCVRRTINGGTKRYIEFFEEEFSTIVNSLGDNDPADLEDAFFIDSGVTIDNPVTISGLTAADPPVVTATGHGFTDGDKVRINDVVGMTEVNGNSYFVARKTTNTFQAVLTTGGKTISAATRANPCVVTATAHGFSNADVIGIFNVLGMTELNGLTYKVKNKTTNTFEITNLSDANINSTGFTAYTSAGKAYNAENSSAFTAYSSDGVVRKFFTAISGLDHLEGEALAVLVDGAVHPALTVSSGAVTLATAGVKVQLGLGYTTDIESLPIDVQSRSVNSDGQLQSISNVIFRLHNTIGFSYGQDRADLTQQEFRKTNDPMSSSVPLFSGDKDVGFPPGWKRDLTIIIQQTQPLPLTLLSTIYRIQIGDR